MEDLMRLALANVSAAIVLGMIVAALGLIVSKRPAVLHCLWVVVLLKLVTPPLFDVPIGWIEPTEPQTTLVLNLEPPKLNGEVGDWNFEPADWSWVDADDGELGVIAAPPLVTNGPSWSGLVWPSLGAVWVGGSLTTLALATSRILRFQRRLRYADPADEEVESEVERLAGAMGLKRPPKAVFIEARITPMLWGLGVRPRLILPRSLWCDLDDRGRTLLLTHELAHLKRGDHRLRYFELAVTILYWWLPLVWWVRRALRDVEEQCCDAWVVWMFPDDARAYAETLLNTVDFLNPNTDPEPLLASGFGKVRHLRRRLTMVMKGKTSRSLGWQGSLAALALAGVLLPMSPSWARVLEEPKQVDVTIAEVRPDDVTVQVKDVVFSATAAVEDDKGKTKDVGDANRDGEEKVDSIEIRRSPTLQLKFFKQDREALIRAIRDLETQLKSLEDPKSEVNAVETQTLKAVIQQLEKLAFEEPTSRSAPSNSSGTSSDTFKFRPPAAFSARVQKNDDPKIQEALNRIEELNRTIFEKQKELGELHNRLAQAQRNLFEVQGRRITLQHFGPEAAERVNELRKLRLQVSPNAAEQKQEKGDKDKSRIDSLEQKVDKLLKELESLKAPRPESGDATSGD